MKILNKISKSLCLLTDKKIKFLHQKCKTKYNKAKETIVMLLISLLRNFSVFTFIINN